MPSTPLPPGPGRLRRAVAALVLGVLAPALTAAAASPAQAAPVRTSAPAAAPAAAPGTAPAAGLSAARTLGITMQQQQQSNWCWAASGNTVAAFYGYGYSQNQFCNLAFGRAVDSACPNSQATLGDVQNAFRRIGIAPGRYVSGYLGYATVQGEIDAGRPVETRIQWSSGGGHMHVLYGYDAGSNWVYWGDPWPSNYRYNWADYRYYTSNSSFGWTHSLYRIGA